MKFMLGQKIEMTQMFDEAGRVKPVTLLQAGPMTVTQVKTTEREGYEAVQVGFGTKKAKQLSKAARGHMKGLGSFRWLREFRLDRKSPASTRSNRGEQIENSEEKKSIGDVPFAIGQRIDVSIFRPGDSVDVISRSKGRGFAGVVKRHGFRGGPKSHGQKHSLRAPGSIGPTDLQRVPKGRRMAGHMGMSRVTVKNLKIVAVDAPKNLLAIQGAIPGSRGTLIQVVGK